MNLQDAKQFLKDHGQWLANSWGMTPEGREYKTRFDRAVEAILDPHTPENADAAIWEEACARILRDQRPAHDHHAVPYIAAIKLTRATFACSLLDGKNRVDELRARLGL